MSQYTNAITDAELLERYAVWGEEALKDPDVAAYVAANPAVIERLQVVLAHYRAPLARNVELPVLGGSATVESSYSAKTRGWARYATIAAAAALVFTAGAQYIPDLIDARRPKIDVRTYATAPGQRARITLPDNSTIILAPGSQVSYASDFGASSNRLVTLKGQALFTVTHASGVPFTVQTGDVATRVLGTSFAVRHYATDTAVQVIVAQGRVSVGSSLLGTGDVATVTSATQVTVTRAANVANQLAWAEGKLVFADIPFRDVIPELERWYGVTITVSDSSLLVRPVVTTLDTETISRAIELVAFAVGARTEQSGRRVLFKSP